MSHRIQKASIFALLDGRLGAFRAKRLKDHLSECSQCLSYFQEIERLRRLVREVPETPEPDWERIDRAVERSIVESAAKKRAGFGFAPATLGLAAAAAVALAVMMPSIRPGDPSNEKTNNAPALAAQTRLFKAPTQDVIAARVLEVLNPSAPVQIGQLLEPGEEVATSNCGSVRIALGAEALIETGEASRLGLVSLDAESPAVEIYGGRLIASVGSMSFGYERGLTVLAGGAEFNVLSGLVEFMYVSDSLTITLIEGEVVASEALGGARLEKGLWSARKSPDSPQWLVIKGLDDMLVSELSALSPLDEQRPLASRLGGTLPVHLVKDSLAPAKLKIRDCYETALKRDPKLAVTVDVEIEVGRSGEVVSAKAAGIDSVPQMKKCIEQVLVEVRFPKPQGGSVEVVFPLRLYPEN